MTSHLKSTNISRIMRLVTYAILTVWAVGSLLPLYWMFSTAIKPSANVIMIPPEWIPLHPTLDNFARLFSMAPVLKWLLNSLIVSVSLTMGCLIFDSMAGYAFAKKKFLGRDLLFWIIMSCTMIPWQVRMVPTFILISDFGWLNTYSGLIIPGLGSAFGTFLMRQFISSLPDEILDSARIDGCSEFGIYYKIIIPLVVPALAVLAIFLFAGTWNNLIWPLIITNTEEMRTLPVGLATLQRQYVVDYGIMMAGSSVCALPVIALFLSLQRYFLTGLTMGALKG